MRCLAFSLIFCCLTSWSFNNDKGEEAFKSPLGRGGELARAGVSSRTSRLPPKKEGREVLADNKRLDNAYQTVYAKHEGSVAAPTAGFHFTPELIEKLEKKGVQFAEVTLHVGLGTFLPVKTDKVEDHKMHSEQVELTAKNVDLINQAKAEGRRVVAVGTTTVRVIEGVAHVSLRGSRFASADVVIPSVTKGVRKQGDPDVAALLGMTPILHPFTGDINIFITPGFKFKIVDALITNFHLPKSTLLMLVSAFAGDRHFMLNCYEEAIKEKYRFYSFGDAMLVK